MFVCLLSLLLHYFEGFSYLETSEGRVERFGRTPPQFQFNVNLDLFEMYQFAELGALRSMNHTQQHSSLVVLILSNTKLTKL